MSQVYAPYGFRPVSVLGQEYNTGGFSEYKLDVDNGTAISVGDPVGLAGGSVTPVTAAPTNALSANTPVGIAWGFTFIDNMGKIYETQYLPAASISTLGYQKIKVKVVDDERALMALCPNAPGPLAATIIGQNCSFTNFGTNGVKTNSTIALDVSSVGTGVTLPLRILRIDREDDLYPDVIVKWNFGVHYYQIGTGH